MKTGKITAALLMLLLAGGLIFTSGCSNSDMARVTINLGIPPQAKAYVPSWIDRIVALISFSTKAQADSVDNSPTTLTTVSIDIETGGTNVASLVITPGSTEWNTGTAAFDVPAGGPYVFTVVGIYKPLTGGAARRLMGGVSTVDSIPGGSDIMVPINMGYLPTSRDYTINITDDGNSHPFIELIPISRGITGYKILRTDATYIGRDWLFGDFSQLVNIKAVIYPDPTTYTDTSGTIQWGCGPLEGLEVSGYRIVPINEHGEGDESVDYEAYYDNC